MERTGWIRYIYITIGGISFILGTAGIVLPLLPTVPFYLLTIFCLARGSQKFHDRFVQSRLYAKYITPFKEDPSLPMRSKCIILGTVTVLLGGTVYLLQSMVWAQIIVGVVWIMHWIGILYFVKAKSVSKGA